ncbi:glutamine synthetase beta-grasp domain-containing protein [Candidatus Woesearchaeota archaeon]|nr:glutamine synthetase beta-grasp domain-containing protein [Candidatus Woesearchaeota archaeon]
MGLTLDDIAANPENADRVIQEARGRDGRFVVPKKAATNPKVFAAWLVLNGIKEVDVLNADPFAYWHTKTYLTRELLDHADKKRFELTFDSSSYRKGNHIQDSDMLFVPDLPTARLHPFRPDTVMVIADAVDPLSGKPWEKDSRSVARRAESLVKLVGADTAYFGPEPEFFLLDGIELDEHGVPHFQSREKREGRKIDFYQTRKQAYFPGAPLDRIRDIRSEIALTLAELQPASSPILVHHHEVAIAQNEINMQYSSLVDIADTLMWYKWVAKNVAAKHGMIATFLPKVFLEDNGSGMHVHISLAKGGRNLFAGKEYAGLSEMALHFAGGIAENAAAVCAITNPTTNDYRRLVPGFEAPTFLALSARNRSAAFRIPQYEPNNPKATRIEFRFPSPACNPYLGLSALLCAGIAGIESKANPGAPVQEDIFEMPQERRAAIKELPGNIGATWEDMGRRRGVFTEKGVFTPAIIDALHAEAKDAIKYVNEGLDSADVSKKPQFLGRELEYYLIGHGI